MMSKFHDVICATNFEYCDSIGLGFGDENRAKEKFKGRVRANLGLFLVLLSQDKHKKANFRSLDFFNMWVESMSVDTVYDFNLCKERCQLEARTIQFITTTIKIILPLTTIHM